MVETCLCCRTGIFAPAATVSECADSAGRRDEPTRAETLRLLLAGPLKPASTEAAVTPRTTLLPMSDTGSHDVVGVIFS